MLVTTRRLPKAALWGISRKQLCGRQWLRYNDLAKRQTVYDIIFTQKKRKNSHNFSRVFCVHLHLFCIDCGKGLAAKIGLISHQ